MNEMPRQETVAKVRITDQFRAGQDMVYDLKCEGVRLSLFMSFSTDIERWTIRAEAKQIPQPGQAQATGSSREEALSVLASAWRQQMGAVGYPPFDWAAIREALAAVRAV